MAGDCGKRYAMSIASDPRLRFYEGALSTRIIDERLALIRCLSGRTYSVGTRFYMKACGQLSNRGAAYICERCRMMHELRFRPSLEDSQEGAGW